MSRLIPPQNGRPSNSEKFLRICIPTGVCHSRSRFDLFAFARFDAERLRRASNQNTCSSANGKCLLRTTDRDHPTGVLRLSHPPRRAALAADSSSIRCILQSGTPSFRLGLWDTGTNPAECSSERPWHRPPVGHRLTSKLVLGGLHHDYRLEKEVA
jgi:hypothetical protein